MKKSFPVAFSGIYLVSLLLLSGCTSLTLSDSAEQEIRNLIAGASTTRLAGDLEILGQPRFPYYRYTDTPVLLERSLADAQAYIIKVYKGLGYPVETPLISNTTRGDGLTATMPNIIAVKRGLDSEAAPIVIGAHWDTVYATDGADDNASGTAALLETARLLAGVELPRDVIFAHFAFEETGFAGSRDFVAGLERTPIAVFNLDCVGYTTETANRPTGSALLGFPKTGSYVAYYGDPQSGELTRRYAEISQRFAPDLPIVMISRAYDIGLFANIYYSDHRSFWEAGIPAVFITNNPTMREPVIMHTPDDRTEEIDLDFLARNVQVCAANTWFAAFQN